MHPTGEAVGEIGPALKKKFTGIVQFDVTEVGTWTLDLKTGDGGAVLEGKGKAKPDLVIKVGDADFASLYDGKSNAQQAFMKVLTCPCICMHVYCAWMYIHTHVW